MASLCAGGNESAGSLKAICYSASEWDEGDNVGEMSPRSSTDNYPAFAHIGLRENPGKNLNQVTCPDRDSKTGHLVSRSDSLTVTPQTEKWKSETGLTQQTLSRSTRDQKIRTTPFKYSRMGCSNNQAEQVAIIKALEAIETIDIRDNRPRTAAILTDSRITIDSLKNNHNHKYLIEEIRKKVLILEKVNWTIEFFWIKYGNELADGLAKAAARNKDAAVCYDKIPKSIIQSEIEEEGKLKWQKEWDDTTKA
ncbi:hypothetical protein ANN_19369 [Periplaneta americana]|uniref:RNase H type-1 domain-containing protein n=1 Tax=Periplaneta americana TaxID=6978 RepID=A0ABQ8SA30_PERAM|nr:hypothetical protein ANN_19369 [Periplaneta americana]